MARGFNKKSANARAAAFAQAALLLVFVVFASAIAGSAQTQYEGRRLGEPSIAFEGTDRDLAAVEMFRLIVRDVLPTTYSAVRIRESIERLHDTGEVTSVTVEATENTSGAIDLRYIIRRKTRALRVSVEIPEDEDDSGVREQDILLRTDLLEPGKAVTEAVLENNASSILEYLRERGFFRAEVTYTRQPLANDTEVAVAFWVDPNEQALVERFDVNVEGFDNARLIAAAKLEPGKEYTREKVLADVERIKNELRDEDFLAPQLNEPRIVYDGERNTVSIYIEGRSGPVVAVTVEAEGEGVGTGTKRALLPVVREGTVDLAAIIEGERRLETHFQERGYFFANLRSVCSVEPPLTESDGTVLRNETEFLCSALNSAELMGKKVEVKYVADLDRKLKLTDLRLTGTTLFTIDEIKGALESQEANILGIIPLFGYGRGYTSGNLLEDDAATIRSLLRELGYREASVRVNQGVSLDGENLIITFVVDEGTPSVITEVDIRGNSAFSDDVLMAQMPVILGKNVSRARVRNAQRKIAEFYSNSGYYDASVSIAYDRLGDDPATGNKLFRVIFNVDNEGGPVYVSRVLISGNENTKDSAILKALNISENELLKAADIYSSEQNLYSSDVFSNVDIKTRPAGDRPGGGRFVDVLVDVQEQAPRILSYGGGFSTDLGPSAFVDIRHFNLLGNLWQGGARARISKRQQLFQVDFINPRFISDGHKRFAPLTVTAGYQRDETVTRFFRSAFDQGTFGIVQRLDEEGNPVDEFGQPTGSPTLNRVTLTAETNRTLSLKDRSIVFLRYRFEDVRLFNIGSLLIRDLLLPDSRIRISGFGATFVRDTRRNCNIKYTILDTIARGDVEEPCRYNATDPTHGSYFTADYNVSVPFLGANVGFNKFQASANTYYTVGALKNTTFAARGILGVASVFSNGNRFSETQYPGLDGILPISERFFAGGSNTLRGFDFESAGPRVVVVPQGNFFNSEGEQVFLDPFTVPFGGNALAVVNLEARVPFTERIRVVPFYDGGNVFRSAADIFKTPEVDDSEVFRRNLNAIWTHTVGIGLRLKTPVGDIGVDYAYLLNPPTFVIPQQVGPPAQYRLPQSQIHFRFSQAF